MQAQYIAHHGIKGQKWGVRRYQNPDGSYTDEGRRRYGFGTKGLDRVVTKNTRDYVKRGAKAGLRVGAAIGGVSALIALATTLPVAGIPYATMSAGTSFVSSMLSTAISGATTGAIFGSAETEEGRRFLRANDTGLKSFEAKAKASRK